MRQISLFVLLWSVGALCDVHDNEVGGCDMADELRKEIASYGPTVDRIIKETTNGSFKGRTHFTLAKFVDKFGSRIAGSRNLEDAIDYMLEQSRNMLLENVHGENVTVPHWVRGEESATLLLPRFQKLSILGLSPSVGTPAEGIKAEAIVVTSFDELASVSNKVKGKIVVFNQKFVSYGVTVQYRDYAASKAATFGAVAVLVRSVTPFSLYTPHTGWMDYNDNVTKIPAASITVEDAKMLWRMQEVLRERIEIEIKMGAKLLPSAISRNTVVEIRGSSRPEKVVIVSGHLDSWDVGQGAMDDGGGAFISWNSLVLLRKLGLRPKRTIRCILWTAEEEGLVGAFSYAKQHSDEFDNINFVMESDEGTFTPLGLEYSGSSEGKCILQEVLKLLKPIDATQINVTDSAGTDILVWTQKGIPGASLLNKNDKYFWYHHSQADTMDAEDPEALDKATALWAAVAYIMADLSADMPKNVTRSV